MDRLRIIVVLALIALPFSAQAGLTLGEIGQVEATPRPYAALPLSLPLQDASGKTQSLRQWLGSKPTIWILADFTCKSLCGPVISIVSDALRQTALRPGTDFRMIVAGLDPQDSAEDAEAMKRAQVGTRDNLSQNTYFLRTDADGIADLSAAFGFRSTYDREHDQYAHPAAAFVATADGHVARALPGLALDSANLRLALIDAGKGRLGSWTDHIKLMCYGFDPATGAYTATVGRMLAGAGALALTGLVLLVVILLRREHATPVR